MKTSREVALLYACIVPKRYILEQGHLSVLNGAKKKKIYKYAIIN